MSEYIVQSVHSKPNIFQKYGTHSLCMRAMEISKLSRLTVALSKLLYSNSNREEWWPGILVKGTWFWILLYYSALG